MNKNKNVPDSKERMHDSLDFFRERPLDLLHGISALLWTISMDLYSKSGSQSHLEDGLMLIHCGIDYAIEQIKKGYTEDEDD